MGLKLKGLGLGLVCTWDRCPVCPTGVKKTQTLNMDQQHHQHNFANSSLTLGHGGNIEGLQEPLSSC